MNEQEDINSNFVRTNVKNISSIPPVIISTNHNDLLAASVQ